MNAVSNQSVSQREKYERKFSIIQASDVQERHSNRSDLDVYTS